MKLTITHSIDKENAKFIEAVSGGWPKILSNLKSLLETGEIALADHGKKVDLTPGRLAEKRDRVLRRRNPRGRFDVSGRGTRTGSH